MKSPLPLGLLLLLLTTPLQAAPSLDAQLHSAAQKGDTKLAQKLVRQGANVNARNYLGLTPLMIAVQKSNEALVNFLLGKGADVRARDKQGFSALGYGPLFAPTLLKRGAKATPNDGAALSDWLENDIWIDSDALDEDVKSEAKMFLRAGMNLNTRGFDEFGTTPLLNAVDSRPSIVPFLLDLGADPNLSDRSGKTPLMAAISPLGWLEKEVDDSIALLLLNRGAKLNPRGGHGETALLMAVGSNRPVLVRELIKRSANLNIRNKFGETALMRAATGGFPALARLLLASGADAKLKNLKGQTALDYARSRELTMSSFVGSYLSKQRTEQLQQQAERELQRMAQGRLEVQAILESKKK